MHHPESARAGLGAALLALLPGLVCPPVLAAENGFPRASAVPGGIAVVELPWPGESAPAVTYRGRTVLTRRNGAGWEAIVGIPLSAKPGRHSLSVEQDGGAGTPIAFQVADKAYATQRITIKDQRKVNPNPADLERIGRERKRIRAALDTWSGDLEARFPLSAPVQGPLSSPFGLRRYFNDQPRRPHSGLDFAVPKGTTVRAPQAGRVVETGDYFFNGKTVFIDHGQGLVTMYCHLDSIDVAPGARVERGEAIGTVGMTGRATGPHLHWGVTLNGTMIDPGLVTAALPEP